MNCPACDKPKPSDEVLVCASCWALVPKFHQIGFRRQYSHRRPADPLSYPTTKFKAEQIVRIAKEKLAAA